MLAAIKPRHAGHLERPERKRGWWIYSACSGGAPPSAGPSFARSREDITALGDSFGDMLTSPVRDAPPMAREAPVNGHELSHAPTLELPREQSRNQPQLRRKAKPTKPGKGNGAAGPQLLRRPGFLAVHSVEKSFGSRQVVRGVSIYVRRGEAVGLLGPNGAGKTTVFYMITGLITADRGAIELDGHDVTQLPMYQRARLGIGYLPQEASIFRGLTVEQNIRAVLEVVEPDKQEARGRARLAARRIQHHPPAQDARRSRSRAASGAASKSRARSRRARTSCCSTSPSPASIRSRSATSRHSCAT